MSKKKKIYKLIQRRSTESTVKNRNSWTFTISALAVVITICFLFLTGKVEIDSATLLSLILAFFSIFLAAQFYFKATDQSNKFYDRSFSHTKNIAESLAGMNAEVTTSLKSIAEHNSEFRNKLDGLSLTLSAKQLEKEGITEDLVKKQKDLIKKYNINENDASEIISKVEEVKKIDNQISRLKKIYEESKIDTEILGVNFQSVLRNTKNSIYNIIIEQDGISKKEIYRIIQDGSIRRPHIIRMAIDELLQEEIIFEKEGKCYLK